MPKQFLLIDSWRRLLRWGRRSELSQQRRIRAPQQSSRLRCETAWERADGKSADAMLFLFRS